MPIVTTDQGISATRNAVAGGFLIDLDRFAFTEAPGVKLSILDSALEGTPVFEGEIQSIEVIGAATIKCNLYIPPGKPVLGSWTLTEVGIYLKGGALFAHGTFRTPFLKSSEFGFNIEVYVTCGRLGEVINVTVGTNVSLGATSVRSLIEPEKSGTNAVVVQDGTTDGEHTAASLALRFGAGGAQWAFVDHHVVYRGRASAVSGDVLSLDPGVLGGFWLNDQEVVTICASTGPGAGKSRRCRYNSVSKTFVVLEKSWNVTAATVLHVWRETKNALPTRNINTPEHFVLGAGINNWLETDPAAAIPAFDLVQSHVSLRGNGTNSIAIPDVPPASVSQKARTLMFVSGRRLGINEFVMHDGQITFSTAPADGAEIGLVYYTEVPSSGSYLTMMPAEYTSYAEGQKLFQLAILPESKHGLIVFDGGRYIGQTHYTYEGSAITFTDYQPVGVVQIIAVANFYQVGATTALTSKQVPLAAGVQTVAVEVDQFEKRNTVVSVDGLVLTKDEYSVASRSITLVAPRSTAVNVAIFIASSQALIEQPDSPTTGNNTGPMWVDPAGVLIPPNRLNPLRVSHIGDGIQRTFALGSRAGQALVFIAGILQDPRSVTIDSTNGTYVLPVPAGAGAEMDVLTFEAFPDLGRESISWREAFQCDGANRQYALPQSPAGREPELTIVSAGGIYLHASQYTLTSSTIAFAETFPAGLKIELWHYASRPNPGCSNRFSLGGFTLSATNPRHVHCFYGDIPVWDTGNGNNSLMFASAVFQYGTVYTIDNREAYEFIVPGVGTTSGVRATSVVIFTGKSKTRLLMRDEVKHLVSQRELEIAAENLGSQIGSNYALKDGSNAAGDWNITVAMSKNTRLSADAGNLIERRPDGLYYGVTAPADVGTLFVDAVNGRDGNVGNQGAPLQTLKEACNRGPSGINRALYLYEGQDHIVDPADQSVMRGGAWTILPYGPQCDALPLVDGDTKFIGAGVQPFSPRIVSLPWASKISSISLFQWGGAFYGTDGASMHIVGCEMHCGRPNGTDHPISGSNGTFHEASSEATWMIRNCRIVMPEVASQFMSNNKAAPINVTLAAVRLVGPGKLVRGPTPQLTLTSWGGAVGANNSTDADIKSYIEGGVAAALQYANFSTNLIPDGIEEYLKRDEVRQMIAQAIAAIEQEPVAPPAGLQMSSASLNFTMPPGRIGFYCLCRWEDGNVGTARMYLNGNFMIIVDVKNDGNSGMYTVPLNAGDNILVNGAVGSTQNTYAYVFMFPSDVAGWNH